MPCLPGSVQLLGRHMLSLPEGSRAHRAAATRGRWQGLQIGAQLPNPFMHSCLPCDHVSAAQHGQLVRDKAAHNSRPSKALEHGCERRLFARRRHTIWWKRCSRRTPLRGRWAQHSVGRPPSDKGLRSLSLRGPSPGPSRARAAGSASLLPLHFLISSTFPRSSLSTDFPRSCLSTDLTPCHCNVCWK